MYRERVLGPEKFSEGTSMALKDLNFSLNSNLKTYKEAATASILHVIATDTVLTEMGVIPHFIEYILS